MKKIIIPIAALALTMSIQAQSSLGYKLNHQLRVYNMHKANAAKGMTAVSADTITVIGTLKDGETCPTDELKNLGVKVKNEFFGMVAMEVCMDQLEALGKVKAFSVINANKRHSPKNKQSRILTNVDKVQDPTNLPDGLKQIYTGKDVLVGVIDEGFDFQHKNFKDADGNSRIKRAWIKGLEYSTPEEINALTCDFANENHGSHTTGTAAGSYSGEYTCSDGSKISGMQGVAYESDLLLSAGYEDDYIFGAIKDMVAYAKAHNQPLAINMSFGDNDAWMDGKNTSTTCLRNASQEGNAPGVLMCVAAGNEGTDHNSFYTEMKAGDKIATEMCFYARAIYDIQICSEDATPFTVKLFCYDANSKLKASYTLDKAEGDLFSNLSYTCGYAADHDGRFFIEITGDSETFDFNSGFKDYVIEISATQDCAVRFFGDGVMCSDAINDVKQEYLIIPADNNCLNSMVQNNYAFAVGAYTSTLSVKTYNSTDLFSDGKEVGQILPYSSWVGVPYKNKTDSIGVDFLAPGSLVLSSFNHYSNSQDLIAKADDNNILGVMEGTSMSTPNATGIMALWLQACPTLTTNQVREIIKNTADNDIYTSGENAIRAGYGKINCLAGLQYILSHYTDISTVNTNEITPVSAYKTIQNGRIIIVKNGKRYNTLGQSI